MSFDVAVIGAGPAGCSTAIALAELGFKVAMVERKPPGTGIHFGESLPPEVRPLFDALGIWSKFRSTASLPSTGVESAWGASELEYRDFLFNPFGSGYHTDRRQLDDLLREQAAQAGVQIFCPVRLLKNCRTDDCRWRLEWTTGCRSHGIESPVLVDATGRASAIARSLGAVPRQALDRAVALAIHGKTMPDANRPHPRLLIESVPDGWWYSLALAGDRSVVALVTDCDLIPRPRTAREIWWRERLARTRHARHRLHSLSPDGPLRTIAAHGSRLSCPVGPGWIAVGDAALALDPLSGLGVYHACEMGLLAARALDQLLRGDGAAAAQYAQWVHRLDAESRALRTAYYRRETRWPESPFWRRRQQFAALSPVARETASSVE